MLRTYAVLRPLAPPTHAVVDWPKAPHFGLICGVVCPLLDGEALQHVQVRLAGVPRDMFVADFAAFPRLFDSLLFNSEATRMYRAAWIAAHPRVDPDQQPTIFGNAVVFDQPVWM